MNLTQVHLAIFLIIIAILIIILIVYLLVILRFCLPYKFIKMENEVFDETNFKTGDIVLTGHHNYRCSFISLFLGVKWHHPGIIYVEPNTGFKYVLELSHNKELFKIPLALWYRINHNQRIAHLTLQNSKGIELDPEKLYKAFEPFIGIDVDIRTFRCLRFFVKTPYYEFSDEDYNKGRACFEVCIHTLQMASVYKKKLSCNSYWISEIINRKIPMDNGFNYSEPKLILPPHYVDYCD